MSQTTIAGHSTYIHHLRGPAADGAGRRFLALHCSLAHGGAWQGFATELFKIMPDAEIWAPDLPGHGKSAWPEGDLHDLATAIARGVAAQIGAGVEVIGHSFGATVALRLALDAPSGWRSLTLVEPVLFAAAKGRVGHGGHLEHDARVRAAQAALGDEAAAEEFHAVWGGGLPFRLLPPSLRAYMTDRMRLVAEPAAILEDDRLGLLETGRLEGLGLPVLLAEGVASPRVVREIHDHFEARLPKVTRLLVGGASHMLPITHPRPLAYGVAGLSGA